MCEKLSELRAGVCRYASHFDPALVTGADATRVMQEASAIERAAATLKAMAATRVGETSEWRSSGARSAAEFLARETGTTSAAAADAIRTAERLKALPEAAAAARRGELSPEQASAVASGATANPGAEKKLVAQAKKGSLQELRQEAARVRAASEGDDGEARRRRIHARRSLKDWTDAEGVWHLHCTNNPEVGAGIMAMLNRARDKIFRKARAEGRREPYDAYGADALDEVVAAYGAGGVAEDASAQTSDERGGTGGASGGAPRGRGPRGEGSGGTGPLPPATTTAVQPGIATAPAPGSSTRPPAPRRGGVGAEILIRCDLGAVLRGYPVEGEVCEIAGYGPVAVSAVREMIESGDPFLAAIITDGVKVTGVAHLRRHPNVYERTALRWLYPTCAAAGCSATARLENDHRDDWAKTHITAFDGLDRLCPRMHDLKTQENWALVEGVGKRPFVPPTDPRHPRNATSPGAQRPPPAANDPPEAA